MQCQQLEAQLIQARRSCDAKEALVSQLQSELQGSRVRLWNMYHLIVSPFVAHCISNIILYFKYNFVFQV